ncbi:hypothetical protein WICPIJ_003129 [Wickerhamomyces pijperi]|uniref:Uncharacterized protein n=1 Tax=Wickerhamomyces pijperi TaxID=599730 RepID=A0A9P8Q898_WICPI|nr:hypothetical protein WICPIJ_003129 [Wickerhamomyces pijperi]
MIETDPADTAAVDLHNTVHFQHCNYLYNHCSRDTVHVMAPWFRVVDVADTVAADSAGNSLDSIDLGNQYSEYHMLAPDTVGIVPAVADAVQIHNLSDHIRAHPRCRYW